MADVMLRSPKRSAVGATVAEVRALLANRRAPIVRLTDGDRFRGAITAFPQGGDLDAAALQFADPQPLRLSLEDSADTAPATARDRRSGRAPVLDDDGTLLGLLCPERLRKLLLRRPRPGED